MRHAYILALILTGASLGSAHAAVCQAGPLTCATTMPAGGYSECTARGATEGGTVLSKPAPRTQLNSTAGGCGAQPNAPGCR